MTANSQIAHKFKQSDMTANNHIAHKVKHKDKAANKLQSALG